MNNLSLCIGAEHAYGAITQIPQEATNLFESYIEKKYADPVMKAFIQVLDGSLASESSVSEATKRKSLRKRRLEKVRRKKIYRRPRILVLRAITSRLYLGSYPSCDIGAQRRPQNLQHGFWSLASCSVSDERRKVDAACSMQIRCVPGDMIPLNRGMALRSSKRCKPER